MREKLKIVPVDLLEAFDQLSRINCQPDSMY